MLSGVVTSPATAQATGSSQILNSQINLGEIFSEQTVNVQTATDGVTFTNVVGGNNAPGQVYDTDAAVTSDQTNQGAIYGKTEVNVGADAGAASAVRTTTFGNSATLGVSNGTISALSVQTNKAEVSAYTQVQADRAVAADLTASTLAMGVAHGVTLNNSAAGARISQSNQANVGAEGVATAGYVSGTAAATATTTGNNINLAGGNQSAARLITDQANTAQQTEARQFTAYGNSYLSATVATATGNNLSADNEGPLLDVASTQWNTSHVRSDADGNAYLFGAAQTGAYAVGNSSQVNNVGTEVVLDNLQNNTGGVEAMARFEGQDGYDAVTTATAMGNAVSSFACSRCNVRMTATNNQTNDANIGASSSTTITSSGRQVTGVSTAIGNSASFTVGSPY